MSSAMKAKLDFWVKDNLNVLFVGRHGVGKTAIVKETFEANGLNWRYFSASTMDPWVDFVGVPREKTEDKLPEQFQIIQELGRINLDLATEWVKSNWRLPHEQAESVVRHTMARKEGITHLDIVRPFSFATGEVEALFFDEFNRSPKKVRNAVMELIQFKSINGHKFPKLKMIWAAINPDDEQEGVYDVEKLDPAQLDRFQVKVAVPYKCDADWFRKTYGKRMADSAIGWWDQLPESEKNNVSPRRLAYALDVYQHKGDMRDILPVSSNVSKLTTALNTGPISEKLAELITVGDSSAAKKFLDNENNYEAAIKEIERSETLMEFFMPVMNSEKLAALMDSNDKLGTYIVSHLDTVDAFHSVCKSIMQANLNPRMVKKIRRALTENPHLQQAFANGPKAPAKMARTPAAPVFSKSKGDYTAQLLQLAKSPTDTELQRATIFKGIVNVIPKKIDEGQAQSTLQLLTDLVTNTSSMKDSQERTTWEFASVLHNSVFQGKFMGVVNHCLEALKGDGLTGTAILQQQYSPLFGKIRSASLEYQLVD
jgi:hypothetical protein